MLSPKNSFKYSTYKQHIKLINIISLVLRLYHIWYYFFYQGLIAYNIYERIFETFWPLYNNHYSKKNYSPSSTQLEILHWKWLILNYDWFNYFVLIIKSNSLSIRVTLNGRYLHKTHIFSLTVISKNVFIYLVWLI